MTHSNRTMRKKTDAGQGGFTLVELLITVALIGIITGVAIVNLQSAIDKTKQRTTMAQIRTTSSAIEAYFNDVGDLPDNGMTAQQLNTLLTQYTYRTVATVDGWDNDLIYSTNTASYTVESYGRDGVDGPANITPATATEYAHDIVLSDGRFTRSPEI